MGDRQQTRNKGKEKASLVETEDEEMDVSELISGSGIVLDLNEDSKVKLEEEDYENYDDDDDADSLDKWMEEDDDELVDDDEITYVLYSKMNSINW